MLFSSVPFLYVFLPLTLAVYFLAPKKARNYVLLIASLLFYFYGERLYTLLLLFSSVSDWLHSLYIEKHRGRRSAKIALISSIVINLAMLAFFKYLDFVIATVNTLFGLNLPLTGVPLPIGISFFTFQTMSYTIDVYRGRVKAERNLATLATFVCLFPQLIAGPIVRYQDIDGELHQRKAGAEDVALGIRRFVFGLGKKVLIANALGEFVTSFRASSDKSVAFFWLYAIAYALQIYFDFSGYSDMAIGLGRIFGFTFPENFNYPFISRSVTEFWRRWHITLGSWFRDYVYIPMGGNRVSRGRWVLSIMLVWALTGLWHGASWNFVLWGVFFGVFLIAEKLIWGKRLEKASPVIGHIYVLLLTLISFVIFNADGLFGVVSDLSAMFGFAGLPLWSADTTYYLKSFAVIIALAAIGSTPIIKQLAARFTESSLGQRLSVVTEPLAVLALMVAVTAYLVDGSFNPFLYFRF